MTSERFHQITSGYSRLRIAIAGDFCLDRYLEIDPAKKEVSLETGLEVYNVTKVRSQPGGAGTIVNNLSALGVSRIIPIGAAGEDGEGYELRQALAAKQGVELDHFIWTDERSTFTYCKPLIVEAGAPPRELNRLDQKNWMPTPESISRRIGESLRAVAKEVDAIILLSQVDKPETGVLTHAVLETCGEIARTCSQLPMVADSRSGFAGFPPVIFKMNEKELRRFMDGGPGNSGFQISADDRTMLSPSPRPSPQGEGDMESRANVSEAIGARSAEQMAGVAASLARRNGQPVFVTLAERGMVGASDDGATEHVAAMPVRGPIDIVGAGDAVTANLTVALASGASVREALDLANAAASVVIHQVGTTGEATVEELRRLLGI